MTEEEVENETVYCENPTCRVVLYDTKAKMHKGNMTLMNCPKCGQFGRTKGKS